VDDPRAALDRALALENETERKLAVVAVIDRLIEWRPIVIGGLAVEFWTDGAYSTGYINFSPAGTATSPNRP
jgi:hypothetical protein